MSLEETIQSIVDKRIDERLARMPREKAATIDAETLARIRELQVLQAKPYLSKQELMLYMDCSDRSIEEWSQRPPDKNPLPVVRVGRDLRIKRERADEWMEREADRYWRLRNLKEAV